MRKDIIDWNLEINRTHRNDVATIPYICHHCGKTTYRRLGFSYQGGWTTVGLICPLCQHQIAKPPLT